LSQEGKRARDGVQKTAGESVITLLQSREDNAVPERKTEREKEREREREKEEEIV
jgi:hypothetical protein